MGDIEFPKSKYIEFRPMKGFIRCKLIGRAWEIVNKDHSSDLGEIWYHYRWRQFEVTFDDSTFNHECLQTIGEALKMLTALKRLGDKAGKVTER